MKPDATPVTDTVTQRNVTGTVTQKNILTPIFYDAVGDNISVHDTSVETALKALKPAADMLGFTSSQVLKVNLNSESGEKISFSRRGGSEQTYMFAQQVFEHKDFAALADAKNPLSEQFKRLPKIKVADPDSVVYTSILGLSILDSGDQTRVTLIDKKGNQLFKPK